MAARNQANVRAFLMVLAGIVIALVSVRRLREIAGFPSAARTSSDHDD